MLRTGNPNNGLEILKHVLDFFGGHLRATNYSA